MLNWHKGLGNPILNGHFFGWLLAFCGNLSVQVSFCLLNDRLPLTAIFHCKYRWPLKTGFTVWAVLWIAEKSVAVSIYAPSNRLHFTFTTIARGKVSRRRMQNLTCHTFSQNASKNLFEKLARKLLFNVLHRNMLCTKSGTFIVNKIKF